MGELRNKYFLLIKWFIKNYNHLIQIKCHPQELKKKGVFPKKNYIPTDKSLYEVLHNYSIIIGSTSSAMIEAARVGLIPIFFLPQKNCKHLWSETLNNINKINKINLLSENLDPLLKKISFMFEQDNNRKIIKIKKILTKEISLIGKESKIKLLKKIDSVI